MDDDVNRSSESLPTSEEYEFVGNTEPKLHIACSGGEEQLMLSLQEILDDEMKADNSEGIDGSTLVTPEGTIINSPSKMEASPLSLTDVKIETLEAGPVVGKTSNLLSMYACSPSPVDEDFMSMSANLADGDYTVFDRITYLGCSAVPDPNSESEIRKVMFVLNEQSSQSIQISLSFPINSEGHVVLYELTTCKEIASFPIFRIKSSVVGCPDSKEANCFALVHETVGSNDDETVAFQSYFFRCEVHEAVSKIVQCFTNASKRVPKLTPSASESFGLDKCATMAAPPKSNVETYVFEATLEFKEEDSKGNYSTCSMDKDYFKLRCKLEKSVSVIVQQISPNKQLNIERCFGLLISPGRNVRNSDMQLIEMVSFNKSSVADKNVYTVNGMWDPNEPVFEVLNTETPKDRRVYMTVAIDFVISGIQEPVRFVIETKAKVLPQNERLWYFSKKALHEKFYLRLREVDCDSNGDYLYQVVSLDSTTQLQRKKEALTLNLPQSPTKSSQPSNASPNEPDSDSDDDEPLLSGTGRVSKDCTESELEGWAEVLTKWRQNLNLRPKSLVSLVKRGIPEALRGEVWQLLAGCHDHKEFVDVYKSLINKDSNCESMIQRDINRTFPAHRYFKEKGGIGQEALLKICKAYSVYDPEVGYCQGLSFLVAALLLHMPEEQAFGVLVKIMFDYHFRDLFRNGFEELHLKFYQLQKLMEDQMSELALHFQDLGIEVHMFASQWFLTLFTAKFPLVVVFFIIDYFLLESMDTIFKVAIALLMLSKKDLLALDFEGILKHFRVSLPKKYRTEESARQLLQTAIKVKVRKLKKYEKEYFALKEVDKNKEDPMQSLQRKNKSLLENNLHLDQENDDLAQELINTKIELRNDLVKSEEKAELLNKELQAALVSLSEIEEEKKRLSTEVAQLKEMCRRELQRAEIENSRNASIIADYKQICSQLSCRLEKEQAASKQNLECIKSKITSCTECNKFVESLIPGLSNSTSVVISESEKDQKIQNAELQARELELELARTKLALVEAECKNQDLTHQLNTATNELQTSKNTWFHKTLSSIRDAGRRDSRELISRDGKETS